MAGGFLEHLEFEKKLKRYEEILLKRSYYVNEAQIRVIKLYIKKVYAERPLINVVFVPVMNDVEGEMYEQELSKFLAFIDMKALKV